MQALASNGGDVMPEADAPPEESRRFLFLQGPSSPLFQWIADNLERLGHQVFRINICAGDRVFWRRSGAVNYRGTQADWPRYLSDFIARNGISEIILLGEERPHHQAATGLAKTLGIKTYAIEMGYLRPDWISIEQDGTGCSSHFPANPQQILAAAADLDDPDYRVRYTRLFIVEAALDLAYNLPNVVLWFLHPHYQWHAVSHPLAEYLGWIRKFFSSGRRAARTQQVLDRLDREGSPFFLYALQLQTDYQIRAHSPFLDQQQAIELVVRSFAKHAPADAQLILKTHPLDNGLIDWRHYAAEIATACGIPRRVRTIYGGELSPLLRRSEGVVTVNSTVGIQALKIGVPVKVLGTAIYDIADLTDQRPLDEFWQAPQPASPPLRDAFFRLLAGALHVRGNFYSIEGARVAAEAIAKRIHARQVNEPGAFVKEPPRPRLPKIPRPNVVTESSK